jgi:hypothetical protein
LKVLQSKIFKKTTSRSIRFFFGGKAAVPIVDFITRKGIVLLWHSACHT